MYKKNLMKTSEYIGPDLNISSLKLKKMSPTLAT